MSKLSQSLAKHNAASKAITLCPYCFEETKTQSQIFRCSNSRGTCQTEPDAHVAKHFGLSNAVPLGHVFSKPKGVATKLMNKVRASGTVNCDLCHAPAKQICPHCHADLPQAFPNKTHKTVLVVGPKGAGKSHFIASLIHSLQENAAHNAGLVFSSEGETTQEIAEESYLAPVFNQRKTLSETKGARENPQIRQPLVYHLDPISQAHSAPYKSSGPLTVSLYDTSGATFFEEQDPFNEKLLAHADALIFIMDPAQLPGWPGCEDLPGQGDVPGSLVHQLEFIINRCAQARGQNVLQIPTCFVLPKVDLLAHAFPATSLILKDSTGARTANLEESKALSHEVMGFVGLWGGKNTINLINKFFKSYTFTALSSLGNTQSSETLDIISPHRVTDPLFWLISEWQKVT